MLPDTLKAWRSVTIEEAQENTLIVINPVTGERRGIIPVAIAKGDDGENTIVVTDVFTSIGPGIWFTEILIPGMCGHYACGGHVTFYHN